MPENEKLAISVSEAAVRLSVSARTVWSLIARGEIPTRRIGRRRVIQVAALETFLRRDHKTGKENAAQ
jgi:excisionase family DNA binding protein